MQKQVKPERLRLPDERQSKTFHFQVGGTDGYITVGLYEDGTPGELFITIAKEGSTVRGLMDAVGVLTSIALQYGVPLASLCQKMRGVTFEPAGFTKHEHIPHASSLLDFIFTLLEIKFVNGSNNTVEMKVLPAPDTTLYDDGGTWERTRDEILASVGANSYVRVKSQSPINGAVCEDCGNPAVYTEGCLMCYACGWSKC